MASEVETIIQCLPDALFVLDAEGRITRVNQVACRMLGHRADEIIGHLLREWIEAEPADLERELALLWSTGSIRSFETAFCGAGDRRTPVSISAALSCDEQGREITGGICIARDISKNLEADRQIREQNLRLQAANHELEAFSYSISHDLRAPLRSIDGFSQALLDRHASSLNEQALDYLRRIRRASNRMTQLIDDLLNLSRLSRTELKKETVNLSEIAQDVAHSLQMTEPARKVDFVIAPGLEAQGDSNLLRVVIENLLNNSWKFTAKHETARIELGSTFREGRLVYFVRDDGAGFNMDFSGRLFGAFQRLHTLSEFAGTGIGLALIQRIIHRHGGETWAEGAIEKGATIYFTVEQQEKEHEMGRKAA